MMKQLVCEGACGDIVTDHAYSRRDVSAISEDARILYRCTACGYERQYGLEAAGRGELLEAREQRSVA